jgi:hypothetical protein
MKSSLLWLIPPATLLAINSTSAREAVQRVCVPSEPLDRALIELAGQLGVAIGADRNDLPKGAESSSVCGNYTPSEALTKLLEHTNLHFKYLGEGADGVFVIRRAVNLARYSEKSDAKWSC